MNFSDSMPLTEHEEILRDMHRILNLKRSQLEAYQEEYRQDSVLAYRYAEEIEKARREGKTSFKADVFQRDPSKPDPLPLP